MRVQSLRAVPAICVRRAELCHSRWLVKAGSLDEVEELLHLDQGGPDSCDAARAVALARKTDLEARIADLQRMRDSLADLIATCDLPRVDRSCPLLAAIDNPPAQESNGST